MKLWSRGEQRRTRRVLVIRALVLEIAPVFGGLLIAAHHPGFLSPALACAALLSLLNRALEVREGVALERDGTVFERRNDRSGFWWTFGTHSLISLGLLVLAAFALVRT